MTDKQPASTGDDSSLPFTDHGQHSRNVGSIRDEDGFGRDIGDCGEVIEIWLKIKRGAIEKATFRTDGCMNDVAAGSMITEMVRGQTIGEAMAITAPVIRDALGLLSEDGFPSAGLATSALRAAVRDYLKFKDQPWKRKYRTQ